MKNFLLFLSFLISITSAMAQEGPPGVRSSTDYDPGTNDSRNNGFGIKGGYNLANVHGDNKDLLPNRDNLSTFMAGVYAQFSLNDKFSIQPEFLYSRKGYKLASMSSTSTKDSTVRLDYLQVPILLVYNFLDNVSIHVGPQVSLLTQVKNGPQDISIDAAGFNSLDYGVVGGVEARVGPARVGARYDLGVAKIRKASFSTAGNKIYNQALQLYVGIGFAR